VKIRGNAHHVAEKYLQLARDAHTGGDPVAAENYLQHAEHYFRLIAAAQAAQALAQSGQSRPAGESDSEDLDDDGDFGGLSDRFASPSDRAGGPYQQSQQGFQGAPASAPNAQQPYVDRGPFEGERQGSNEHRQGPNDRGGFPNRQDRQGNRFQDRALRPDRPFGERPDGYRDNRRDGRPREFRPYRDSAPQPAREGAADNPGSPGLPSFITTGPRPGGAPETAEDLPTLAVAVSSPSQPGPQEASSLASESPSSEGGFPVRGRRRRLRSPYGFNAADSVEQSEPNSGPEDSDKPIVNE
jgi:hypothetical protein